jgi:excisionase family DNA binding protein
MPEFFPVKEIAKTLKVKESVVRTWIREDHLPALKFRKTYRIPSTTVKELFEHGLE